MERLKFLERVETFLRDTGMSASAFGMRSKEEPNFVFTLRKGRECREDTQNRVLSFINNYEEGEKTNGL